MISVGQEQLGQVVWLGFPVRLQSDRGLAGVIFKVGHSSIWRQSWEHAKSWQLKHREQSTSHLMWFHRSLKRGARVSWTFYGVA